MKRSVEINSSSLMADAWHHRSDAITSVAAFIGISIALILGNGYQQMTGPLFCVRIHSLQRLFNFQARSWRNYGRTFDDDRDT
jgi:hypothetical protein